MSSRLWPSLAGIDIYVGYTLDRRRDTEHETIIWAT